MLEDVENLAPMQFAMGSGALDGVATDFKERRIYWVLDEMDRRIGQSLPSKCAVSQIMEFHSASRPIPHAFAV